MLETGKTSILIVLGLMMGGLVEQARACDCYYNSDCSAGQTCLVPICSLDGKIDGVCTTSGGGGGGGGVDVPDFGFTGEPDRDELVTATDLYFRAYIAAVRRGNGRPDGELLEKAMSARLAEDGAASERNHRVLLQTVHEVLDAVLGWDFQQPHAFDVLLPEPAPGPRRFEGIEGSDSDSRFGGIRAAPSGAVEIAEAARAGLVAALKEGDPDRVSPPLRSFWESYPDYRPSHVGRYYPHGHEDEPESAEASQIDVLRTRYARLVAGAAREDSGYEVSSGSFQRILQAASCIGAAGPGGRAD